MEMVILEMLINMIIKTTKDPECDILESLCDCINLND